MKRFLSFLMTLLIVFVISSDSLYGEVKLPAIFGDNMVLQQKTDAAIWGTAGNGSNVKVTTSWNKKSYSVKAGSDGKWKVKVATPSAGGPFNIIISDGTALSLKNVMIGEVWVCSGQSNMEMPMKGYMSQPVLGANEAIASSANPSIRLFTVKKATSLQPLDNFTGDWKNCEPENVSEFSATAYYFGLMLYKALNVPIGLINTSWGGTRIEPWMSEAGLKEFDFVKLPDKNQQGALSMQTPTVLFNAMINPLVGYGIKGAIWYQGESNRNEAAQYVKLLPGMIKNWRTLWNIGDFPFYYVQIAPYDYGSTGLSSAFLREAQLNAVDAIPNIGMASVMDIGEKDIIHPKNKKIGSDRLAYLALANAYGKKGFAFSGPVLKEMTISGSVIKLTFNYAANGLISYGKELSCFEVAGSNKRFFPAQAFIIGNGVTIFCPNVAVPVAVRYEGLPASSFRTDTWE